MIKGVRYPIEYSPRGFLHESSDIEQIKSSMLMIILTIPGERVMELGFGTPLHLINVLQPIEGIEQQVRRMIASSLKKFEKRVQVNDIQVVATRTGINQYDLRIDIDFIEPTNIQKVEKLTLETTIGTYIYCK